MSTPSSGMQHGFRKPGRISQTPSRFTHKTPFLTSSSARTSDDINGDEPEDEVDKSATDFRQCSGPQATTQIEHDFDIEDPVIRSRYANETSSSVHKSSRPAKRRKISNYTASSVQDTVSISSSDSSIDLGVLDDDPPDNQRHAEQTVALAEAPSPPSSPTSTLRTPRTATSRFRHIAPPTQPSTATQNPQPRPSFMTRLRQPPPDRGPHPGLAFTLPEAFSPSRRRSKAGTEYVRGGSAETVRGWILETAGRVGGEEGDVILRVENAVRDQGGRFVLVKASNGGGMVDDGDGEEDEGRVVWLLVDSDSHVRRGGGRKVDLVRSGVEIVVKGGKSMRWRLPLGEDGQKYMFAALWDVK